MLIHIRPRLFSPFRDVHLMTLSIDPMKLFLFGHRDLVTRRPYPNKAYAVACRKQGQKAMDGILLETEDKAKEFRYLARWIIEGRMLVCHEVDYKILDDEFDAASDDMKLWYACDKSLGGWSDRRPDYARDHFAPGMYAEPMMEVELGQDRPETEDEIDATTGYIFFRHQTFVMPTLERERILNTRLTDRMPSINSAFRCG